MLNVWAKEDKMMQLIRNGVGKHNSIDGSSSVVVRFKSRSSKMVHRYSYKYGAPSTVR